MDFIPYGRQYIEQEDVDAVISVLCSDFLTQGPWISRFEESIKDSCGAAFACAVSNATSALHLAYLALGVGEGDTVWTSPNTFLSTANAALMCGAEVDFVDICPHTYNMSMDALNAKLIEAQRAGHLPKVVVPVHFAGQPCDMRELYSLSQQYGFRVVEDAAHAIGAYYQGKPVGSCQYSDITVFSFHPVKIITTGEGGALTTNDKLLANKIEVLRSHGVTRDPEIMEGKPDGGWSYQMLDLGYNYRITDIQCALGYSQLKRLESFIERRYKLRKYYDELLANCHDVQIPHHALRGVPALHLYPIKVPQKSRKVIFDYLRNNNIGVNVHYMPVYLQPYYQKLGFKVGCCPNAENYYSQAISLPMYPGLEFEQLDYVCDKLKEGLELCD
ncbi:MAG: UDP-4-amino-4,6-dideoxy-N-acetyl-beta-L-altrosamine transaminase [Chlamydiota bacterium]